MEGWTNNYYIVVVALTLVFGIGMWVQKVNTSVKAVNDLKSNISAIKANLDRIIGHMFGPERPSESKSPVRLTEYGEGLSEAIGAKQWAEETASNLLTKMQGKEAYEIHELSFQYVREEFQPTVEQEALYKRSVYERGAPRVHVDEVLALELRDCLLTLLNLTDQAP